MDSKHAQIEVALYNRASNQIVGKVKTLADFWLGGKSLKVQELVANYRQNRGRVSALLRLKDALANLINVQWTREEEAKLDQQMADNFPFLQHLSFESRKVAKAGAARFFARRDLAEEIMMMRKSLEPSVFMISFAPNSDKYRYFHVVKNAGLPTIKKVTKTFSASMKGTKDRVKFHLTMIKALLLSKRSDTDEAVNMLEHLKIVSGRNSVQCRRQARTVNRLENERLAALNALVRAQFVPSA